MRVWSLLHCPRLLLSIAASSGNSMQSTLLRLDSTPYVKLHFGLARLWGSFHVPARAPIPCPTPSSPYKPYTAIVASSFTIHLLHCPSPFWSLSAAIERACPLYLGTSPHRVPMAPSTTPSGMSKTTCSSRSRLRLPIEVCIVPYIFFYIEQAHSTSRRYLLRD